MSLKNVSRAADNQAAADMYKKGPKKRLTHAEIEKMRERDSEIVRGLFTFTEQPGGILSFPFLEYPGDEVQNYDLVDNTIIEIPRGVARHLVNNLWYPDDQYKQDINGKPIAVMHKKNHRCTFQSLDFMDERALQELTPSKLVQVSTIGSSTL